MGLKYLNSLMRIRDPGWRQFGSGIRDPGWTKVGSGIRDKHPGSATLSAKMYSLLIFFSLNRFCSKQKPEKKAGLASDNK
jgi:hypothetical protein